jgi:predicted O-linked N-acetylglucosamine transferase (SPINDLY family)
VREQSAGRLAQAAAAFERLLQADPDHVEALCNYALLALQAGQPQAAVALAQRALRAQPGSPEAHQYLGIALRQCGRLADAITHLQQAVSLAPDYFDARLNLGNALSESNQRDAALVQYRQAIALNPRSAVAHNNLGNMHLASHRPAQAMEAYRNALALDARYASAHANLGAALRDLGEFDAAIASLRSAVSLAPDRLDFWSNLLFALCSSDEATAEAIHAEHAAFGARFAQRMPPLPGAPSASRREGRMRIGYVSADFRDHAVARFLGPLFAAHDRTRFEIFCYCNQLRGDAVTERVCGHAEHFVTVRALNDRALAERVRQDGIDVLVDLGGHTADNRLGAFFLRAAPVQVTWLGYLGETGVPTMDFRLTDVHADPPHSVERPHTEALWRLPRTLWCYEPYPEAPEVGPPPASGDGVVFGCLNSPGKTTPRMLDAWARLLSAVPDSRLLLRASTEPARAEEIRRRFAHRGIAEHRLELLAQASLGDYLGTYQRLDIALDTSPYCGGATTCDALWMGVPVVTLARDRPFGRGGASILANVGLPELVAENIEDYVRIAQTLAQDPARRAHLRSGLRQRMRESPLLDAHGFARDVEAAYEGMVEARSQSGP